MNSTPSACKCFDSLSPSYNANQSLAEHPGSRHGGEHARSAKETLSGPWPEARPPVRGTSHIMTTAKTRSRRRDQEQINLRCNKSGTRTSSRVFSRLRRGESDGLIMVTAGLACCQTALELAGDPSGREGRTLKRIGIDRTLMKLPRGFDL